MEALADFTSFEFEHRGKRRVVFRQGSGPAVVLVPEIPGITPEAVRLARYIVRAGLTVFMPNLFGTPGKPATPIYAARQIARACISREFKVFAENRSSPIVDWLRALAHRVFVEIGGKGVGVIGMCITGNFALTMVLDRWVIAPVLAQPSLPFALTKRKAAALHASPEALAHARKRCTEEGLTVLGLRFAGDPICRRERFGKLRDQLAGGFESIELPDSAANPRARKPVHSVLTLHLIDADGAPTKLALERVLGFLRERLL